MRVYFKDCLQTIDTEKEILRVFAFPGKVYYVNTQQDYYDTVTLLESLGAGFSTEVVTLEEMYR